MRNLSIYTGIYITRAIAITLLAVTLSFITTGCNENNDSVSATSLQKGRPSPIESLDVVLASMDTTVNACWGLKVNKMPDNDIQKLSVNPPAGRLREIFRDSNYIHYAAGKQLGINPIIDLNDIWDIKRDLIKINSCADFYVDTLHHSYPYLVPEAANLLHEIGRSFNDSLKARGGGRYRIKVTSMLRTDRSISRLRRVNRAAVDSSAHRFGTTFDICFSFFIWDGPDVNRSQEDLKNLLAEILWKLRQQQRCFIIYESRRSCFHITACPKNFIKPEPPVCQDNEDL